LVYEDGIIGIYEVKKIRFSWKGMGRAQATNSYEKSAKTNAGP
jgi:hypothetical protein